MIKFKGTTIFPIAIQDILNSFDSILGHVVEISTNNIGTDHVHISLLARHSSDAFKIEIMNLLRSKIRVVPEISFITEDELNRIVMPLGSRKPKVIIDKR